MPTDPPRSGGGDRTSDPLRERDRLAGRRLVQFLEEMMTRQMYGDITITLRAGSIVYVLRQERFAADAIPVSPAA